MTQSGLRGDGRRDETEHESSRTSGDTPAQPRAMTHETRPQQTVTEHRGEGRAVAPPPRPPAPAPGAPERPQVQTQPATHNLGPTERARADAILHATPIRPLRDAPRERDIYDHGRQQAEHAASSMVHRSPPFPPSAFCASAVANVPACLASNPPTQRQH
jgi:hypothetical protein